MKTLIKSIVLIAAVSLSIPSFANDRLATGNIVIDSKDSEDVLDRTLSDLRAVFQRFKPNPDGGEWVRELVVSGSRNNPILQMALRKCVAFICETVELDADVTLREVRGQCDRNFVVEADLSRSSRMLTDHYRRLDTEICFNKSSNGKGTLSAVATAIRASGFKKGIVQGQILSTLKAQARPIIRAVDASLKANL